MSTNQHPEDPAEGSRKTIERELERSDKKRPAGGMRPQERGKGSARKGEEGASDDDRGRHISDQ